MRGASRFGLTIYTSCEEKAEEGEKAGKKKEKRGGGEEQKTES
jgi:hypothetical protein